MKSVLTVVVLLILGALRLFEYKHGTKDNGNGLLYDKNHHGKVAFCEICAYDGVETI